MWYNKNVRYINGCEVFLPWGKSEHYRVRCQLTAGGGDPKDSATENKQHGLCDRWNSRLSSANYIGNYIVV